MQALANERRLALLRAAAQRSASWQVITRASPLVSYTRGGWQVRKAARGLRQKREQLVDVVGVGEHANRRLRFRRHRVVVALLDPSALLRGHCMVCLETVTFLLDLSILDSLRSETAAVAWPVGVRLKNRITASAAPPHAEAHRGAARAHVEIRRQVRTPQAGDIPMEAERTRIPTDLC